MSEPPRLESLAPIPEYQRIFSLGSYIPFWWSSLIVVQAFLVGLFMVAPIGPLNLIQAGVVTLASSLTIAVLFASNAYPGMRHGIPFVVQLRQIFGIRGAPIVAGVRIVPAFAWYGIGSWIGAQAADQITRSLFGFGGVPLYFAVFTGVQTLLAIAGVKSIKWFDVSLAALVVCFLGYIAVAALVGVDLRATAAWNAEGTWGRPFLVVFAASVSALITGAVNIADLSRHLKSSDRNNWAGHVLGLVPPWAFMLGTGVLAGLVTGEREPVAALIGLAASPLVVGVLLAFIIAAQFTTNLTLNILPPAHFFQDLFKIGWAAAVVLTSLLSMVCMPWLLLESGNFLRFLAWIGLALGPILGVMLADHWVVHRWRPTDPRRLYDVSPGGACWFSRGFRPAGILSLVIATGLATWSFDLAWMVGLPVGFVLYPLLVRLFE